VEWVERRGQQQEKNWLKRGKKPFAISTPPLEQSMQRKHLKNVRETGPEEERKRRGKRVLSAGGKQDATLGKQELSSAVVNS